SETVIKCKAAVAWEPNKPVTIEEIEVAPPEADEVRIKIVATSVCHTDLYHLFEGMHKDGFPVVLGHEAAGIVESVGSGVTEFHLSFTQGDFSNAMSPLRSRLTCKGKKVYQFSGISTFSEYTVVKQINVTKIDPAAPLDKVCLLGCGICTGYGAAVNTAKVEEGSTCAVFGLGAIGLAAVMGCKNAGAKRIIAVDINPDKFEKAKVFGATDFVNPKDHDKPISQVLFEMTNGGVDYSLECVGNVGVMRSALESTIPAWGVSVIVGWTTLHDFSAPPGDLIAGRTWKGTMFGGFKSKDGVPEMVNAYMNKKLMVDEFITDNMTFDQINDAIEMMKHGKCFISRSVV
uniref:Enoyl reductase (ER) domain-containing protein n=1 Tax=Sphaeramia orbicularis TaxID=375764 RepID=A0A672YY85_9TELE